MYHFERGVKMGKAINLKGLKVGRLTVLERAENNERGQARWLCKCECGNMATVDSYYLRTGHTKSCGCIRRESKNKTHGKSHTKLYNVWSTMKRRCYSPGNTKYKNYGARGIQICDEWRNDFVAFYEWAINSGYKEGLTIDRVDVDEGYRPGNCKWATLLEQAQNKTNSTPITFRGKTMSVSMWARETGIKRETIKQRIANGWSIKDALTRPTDKSNNSVIIVPLEKVEAVGS